ncbi:hypothetical protein AB3X86_37275, partial [Paraburkholderia sp. BR14374]
SSAPSATFHLPRQKPLTMQISLSLSLWHDASKTVSGKPGAAHRLIREGILPATQLMPSAPSQVPVAELDSEAVREGVRAIKERRPPHFKARQEAEKSLKLPGF